MGSTEGGGVDGDRNELASLGESRERQENGPQMAQSHQPSALASGEFESPCRSHCGARQRPEATFGPRLAPTANER